MPLRLLHIGTARTWRGGEQQIAYLFEELQKKPCKQLILCKPNSELSKYFLNHDIEVIGLPPRPAYRLKAAAQLRRICERHQIDLVHLHDSHAHTIAFLSATLFGNKTPFVLSRRVDFPVQHNYFSSKKYNHPAIKRILCVSKEVKKIMAYAVYDHTKLEVVYDGIDIQKFEGIEKLNILRHELNIPDNVPLVGNTSALADHKDYFTFIDTAKLLLSKNKALHFMIIGKGPMEKEIKAYAQSRKLGNNITFTGFRDDVIQILPELDVFLMTSKTEGLGTSLLDAMAAGVPIVSTNAGGIPEIIKHEQTGLLTGVKDVSQLATEVLRILKDTDLRNKLITSAKEFVKGFSKEQTAEKTWKIYEDVLQ